MGEAVAVPLRKHSMASMRSARFSRSRKPRPSLSVSPCHHRLRDLEREGAIHGYRAIVDPAAVGLNFEALVFVTLRWEDPGTVTASKEAVAAVPHILRAQRLFGELDYLLRVATANLAAFQQLYVEQFARLPAIQRPTSTVVMKHVVDDRPLPASAFLEGEPQPPLAGFLPRRAQPASYTSTPRLGPATPP